MNALGNFLKAKWNFYLTGALFSFVFIVALFLLNAPIGMTDAWLAVSDYWSEVMEGGSVFDVPSFDWQTGFLFGVFAGAVVAAGMSKEWKFIFFPEECKTNSFFASLGWTLIRCGAGGFLVMLGLQLAGDSFVGQWAAAIQRSTGALMFIVVMLFTGIVGQLLINAFHGKGGGGGGK